MREEQARPLAFGLAAITGLLTALRLWASAVVGFGDSEALYASWAIHPQPAYLDHPGLVGLVARTIGEGAAPSPERAHLVTTIVAGVVPWLVVATARALGARERGAYAAAIAVALVPEIAVGLFAMTPDLLLCPAWLGAILLAALGLRAMPGSLRAQWSLLGAGLLAGIGASAKVSGVLLLGSLGVGYAWIAFAKAGLTADADDVSHRARANARSPWPWAGIVAGLVVITPVLLSEIRHGFPMTKHRLVDTQHGAGLAVTNLGAVVGGQLLYISPVAAWLALQLARDLVRNRSLGPSARLLTACFLVPLVPLVALSIWSRVAEPHWIAPALLALPLWGALAGARAGITRRATGIACATAATLTVLAHAWVLVPASARLFPRDADPKADIASELYGWPTVLEAVRAEMTGAAAPADPEGREVVVVGPHWTVCAQLHSGLPGVRVGCATPIKDDFDGWLPRDEWRRARDVLFVTDNRFGGDGGVELPLHVPVRQSRVRIMRGGRTARVFELTLYARQGASRRPGSDGASRGLGLARRAIVNGALSEQEEHQEAARNVDHREPRTERDGHHRMRDGDDGSGGAELPADEPTSSEANRGEGEDRDEREGNHVGREERDPGRDASGRDEADQLRERHGGRNGRGDEPVALGGHPRE